MSKHEDTSRGVPANTDASSLRTVRTCVLISFFCVWFLLTMSASSENTSWESHPFAGPFILLKGSVSAADLVITGFVWAMILLPAGYWAWSGKLWAAIVAMMMVGLSICLSMFAAASASV